MRSLFREASIHEGRAREGLPRLWRAREAPDRHRCRDHLQGRRFLYDGLSFEGLQGEGEVGVRRRGLVLGQEAGVEDVVRKHARTGVPAPEEAVGRIELTSGGPTPVRALVAEN